MDLINKINEKIARGEILYGTHTFGGAPMLTEAVSMMDYDFIWIDMEHTAIDKEAVFLNLIAAKAGGTASMVRIPWNDPILAKPIIDMGPDGVIFPYIRTYEDALLAARSCEYPPLGIRGYGPLRALKYGAIPQMDYVTKEYKKMWRVLQIEHIDMVGELEKICDIEQIDAFIVGPNDLAASLGHIGDIRHPDIMPVYQKICEILRRRKKIFGVSTNYNKEFLSFWLEAGARILFVGTDVGFICGGAQDMLKTLKTL